MFFKNTGDSIRTPVPLVLEATTLPAVLQPLPQPVKVFMSSPARDTGPTELCFLTLKPCNS